MSKPFYLYRAVTVKPIAVQVEGEDEVWAPGVIIGRQSGYLSRSSALAAGFRDHYASDEFEVIRSEPVKFLTAAEKREKRISELESELAVLLAAVSS